VRHSKIFKAVFKQALAHMASIPYDNILRKSGILILKWKSALINKSSD